MARHFSEVKEIPRLEIFIDAILAIIITILVLEFKVPEKAFSSDQEIRAFIWNLAPSFFSYGISFATIVGLWIDHHFLFRMIEKADIRFTFLNFVFILFLSPIPFTSALAGRNYESGFAVALVALIVVAFGNESVAFLIDAVPLVAPRVSVVAAPPTLRVVALVLKRLADV